MLSRARSAGQLQREDHRAGLEPWSAGAHPGDLQGCSQELQVAAGLGVGAGRWAGPAGREANPLPGTRRRAWGGLCLNTREVNCLET